MCGVEGGFVDEDGLTDGGGADGPLDLKPGLLALFGIVVEEGAGLGPETRSAAGRIGLRRSCR